jgi:hypothetical protein
LVGACAVAAFGYSGAPKILRAWPNLGGSVIPDILGFTAAAALQHVETIAIAAALWFIFWSSGRMSLRALKSDRDSSLESAILASAIGIALWGQLFLLLGLAGLLNSTFLRLVLGLGIVLGVFDVSRYRPSLWVGLAELREAGMPWLILIGVHLAILAPFALVPETSYDALEYHLGLPSLYLLRGRIDAVPDNVFSGIPSIPSMISGWSLTVSSSGNAAHFLNFSYLVMACLTVVALARRLGRPSVGGIAATLFVLTPCVSTAGTMTGVECAGAFLLTAALIAVLAALEADDRKEPWIAAGLIIGAAMATKNLLWSLPLAASTLAFAGKRRPGSRNAAWATGAAAFILGPWLVKNAVFYGNPLFPIFETWIHPGTSTAAGSRYLVAGASVAEAWRTGLMIGLKKWVWGPVHGIDFNATFSESFNPILIGMLPIGLWAAWKKYELRPIFAFVAVFWVPISLLTDMPRYFIPALPIAALLVSMAIGMMAAPVRIGALVVSILGAAAVWRGTLPLNRLAVFAGQQSEESLLEHTSYDYYPAPSYAGMRWINANASASSRVLIFGDARGFYLERDHLLSTPAQTSLLERWAGASTDAQSMHALFVANGVDFILVNHGEIIRERLALSFTVASKRTFDAFWRRYTRKVFQVGPEELQTPSGTRQLDRWVVVYRVLSEAESAKSHDADDLFSAYSTRINSPEIEMPTQAAKSRSLFRYAE